MSSITTTLVGDSSSKSVGDPIPQYESLLPFWKKARAILGGQDTTKAYDLYPNASVNLLLPFSPKMSIQQYDFYKSEAELPGLVSQYSKVLTSGILRKPPEMGIPEDAPEGAEAWLKNDFTADGRSIIGFLDEALTEEVKTSRAWVAVNFPHVPEGTELSTEEMNSLKPYPILLQAESVINWKEGFNPITRQRTIKHIIIRQYTTEPDPKNEFHDRTVDRVWVHEINNEGNYQIRVFDSVEREASDAQVVAGVLKQDYQVGLSSNTWKASSTEYPMSNGEFLDQIPIFPFNGKVEASEPMLMPLINREIALYNKVSRRNHLMYGAATYTPVVASDMTDEEFEELVNAGLGNWLKVRDGEKISVLDTPTDALKDMDRAIESATLEMGRMGIRMMTPDVRDQSGVALEIRNAGQNAQLGTLNTAVSNVMSKVIATMMNWRYGTDYKGSDIDFVLSADFNPAPLGADWLRLVTEWYETSKLPRSEWLNIMKANDIISPEYNDEDAKNEIMNDELIPMMPSQAEELDMENMARQIENTAPSQVENNT